MEFVGSLTQEQNSLGTFNAHLDILATSVANLLCWRVNGSGRIVLKNNRTTITIRLITLTLITITITLMG